MIFCDYHTHTPLCRHALGTPKDYVHSALTAGLREYGISDHAPLRPEPFDDWRMTFAQLPNYLKWIEEAREVAGDALIIRAGLECDWLPEGGDAIETLRDASDWDYLIGSVHYLADQWDFDNPKWIDRWATEPVEEVWAHYWETYAEMVRSGLFDICAHPDLIKKFGYVPQGDLSEYYRPTIEALVETRSVIELNTAGWHKPCQEAYPSLEFLTLCASSQVPLVLSSDAHHPSEVARDFERAAQLAMQAGYRGTTTVHRGTREFLPFCS